MRSAWVFMGCAIVAASNVGCSIRNNQASAPASLHQYEPGFNFFSKEQDVELGKEAAGEIEKQVEVIDKRELNACINSIGAKLAAQPQADKYPYTLTVVNDPSINAFALPGRPAFVHTGLIPPWTTRLSWRACWRTRSRMWLSGTEQIRPVWRT